MRRRSFRGRSFRGRRYSRKRYSGAAKKRALAAKHSRPLSRIGFRL